MAGELADITDPIRKTISHINVAIANNTLTQIVPAVAGSRIKVRRLEIGTDTAGIFYLRSGNNDIINIHILQNDSHSEGNSDEGGKYVCNPGEPLTIQSSQAAPDANVYIQYWYDSSPGDYS